jgi:hypothetical protein
MTRIAALTFLGVTALPFAVIAQEPEDGAFSYRFVDVAHFPEVEIDGGRVDADGDGFQLRGSLPVLDNFFVYTEFQDLSLDNNADTTRFMVGGGAHWPLSNTIDIVGRLGVVNYQVDVGAFDDDDTGIFLGARIRALLTPKLEVEGGVEHQHVDAAGLENDTYLIGEARYRFTPQFAAGVLANLGGDTTLLGVQARYSF